MRACVTTAHAARAAHERQARRSRSPAAVACLSCRCSFLGHRQAQSSWAQASCSRRLVQGFQPACAARASAHTFLVTYSLAVHAVHMLPRRAADAGWLQAGRLQRLRKLRWPGLPKRARRLLEETCPHVQVAADALGPAWPPADRALFEVVADQWDLELAQAAPAVTGALAPAWPLIGVARAAWWPHGRPGLLQMPSAMFFLAVWCLEHVFGDARWHMVLASCSCDQQFGDALWHVVAGMTALLPVHSQHQL